MEQDRPMVANEGRNREEVPAFLHEAVGDIRSGVCSFVLVRDGQVLSRGEGRGVKPILTLYTKEPAAFRGAGVADKIIGKAAAMILHLGGVGFVWGQTMSEAACGYLQSAGIPYAYGTRVPLLLNRTGDGSCPLEAAVLGVEDANEGLGRIRETVARLMAGAGTGQGQDKTP